MLSDGEWREGKSDTRDLLGGVVSIKTTFANFLDHWPEYSTARFITSNVVEVYNALPYRVGDNVRAQKGQLKARFNQLKKIVFYTYLTL